jgi:predicted nucleic acid-binding protein
MAEIRFGIEVLQDPSHRALLTRWLTTTIRPVFAGRVLPITEDTMLRWRLLVEDGRKAGKTFSQPDLIIAATAIEHELVLVTRNVKDFISLLLTIVDPWREHA